ncbi:MAG: hypothetical protein CTY20_14555 [Hyphomicrobium sp.]|nr:MAG: hypothetical protein CTY20_14555 [Hyphomicrobium sp.]
MRWALERLSRLMIVIATVLSCGLPLPLAQAASDQAAFMELLEAGQRRQFEAYMSARTFHDFELDKFWRECSDLRALRKRKKAANEELTRNDYVRSFPPEYKGPQLSTELAKAWAAFQAKDETAKEPPRPLPTVADFLAAAKEHYAFEPERIPEREFKLRYAREALALGLTKEQVVRVYALETGGQGTADMQAGINPITKKGSAISSALGYAQLLHANSVNEIAKHGPIFVERLRRLSIQPGPDRGRRTALARKLTSLRAMVRAAKSVPLAWEKHQDFAKTPRGYGIHALNLDGDIGPWLQVIKLQGIMQEAQKAGRSTLRPVEMELMNLAGPGTGLEMMLPAGLGVPTVNFFARGGYERNTIVRGKTSAELLAALDSRMDDNEKKPGAVEFAAVFDELKAKQAAGR